MNVKNVRPHRIEQKAKPVTAGSALTAKDVENNTKAYFLTRKSDGASKSPEIKNKVKNVRPHRIEQKAKPVTAGSALKAKDVENNTKALFSDKKE